MCDAPCSLRHHQPTAASQDQTFCSSTGFKREVKCVSSALVNDSASVSGTLGEMRERESYLAFQGCSPEPSSTFGAVVKFEARSCDDAHARRARAAPLATTTTRAHHTPTASPARSTATMAQRNVPPPQGETPAPPWRSYSWPCCLRSPSPLPPNVKGSCSLSSIIA